MKKWALFAAGAFTIWFAFIFVMQKQKANLIQAPVTIPATPMINQTAGPVPAAAPVDTAVPEFQPVAEGPEPEAKQPEFFESVLGLISLYREANQAFLGENTDLAERSFKKVLEGADALRPNSDIERQIKRGLVEAAGARAEAVTYFTKTLQSPEDSNVELWWNQNIELLKKANAAITSVVKTTGQALRDKEDLAAEGRNLMLDDLQKNARGILVVSKAQS